MLVMFFAGTETLRFNAVLEVANMQTLQGEYTTCSVRVSQKAQAAPKEITYESNFHIKRYD